MVKAARPQTLPDPGALKRQQIEANLRAQIIAGSWQPGGRLPTRTELEAQFDVSSVTVQLALDRLIEDGFVRADGRRGTFVSAHPPHLYRYGLCFPSYPHQPSEWPRFWTALANEALKFQSNDASQPRRIALYHGIDGKSDSDDARRLLDDINHQRLAGVIFGSHPHILLNTPFMEDRGVPRVAIMPQGTYPHMGAVSPDLHSFLDKALDCFQQRGRKRIAVLTIPGMSQAYHEYLAKGLAQRGLVTRPHWLQLASPKAPECARHVIELLLHKHAGLSAAEYPDALLITDDNLVEHATAGLIAAGVRVPEQLDVIAHCNFPWPAPSMLPFQRLGYDAREVLARCLDYIDAQRAGRPIQAGVEVRAKFEADFVSGL